MAEQYECVSPWRGERLPDNKDEWPPETKNNKLAMETAGRRFFDEHPEKRLVSDSWECMGREHPRFPETDESWSDIPFWLVRTITVE